MRLEVRSSAESFFNRCECALKSVVSEVGGIKGYGGQLSGRTDALGDEDTR